MGSTLTALKNGKLVIGIKPGAFGLILKNKYDFINTFEHERGSHGAKVLAGAKYDKNRDFWDWETKATIHQLSQSSWKKTSIEFKSNLYAVYGKKVLSDVNQRKHFGNYGVKLDSYWMERNKVK